jgi:5'-nucleotidase/UDP-sugar diphosphatase
MEDEMKRKTLFWAGVFGFFLWSLFGTGLAAEIRILHVNDFHGFAQPYKPFGSEDLLGGISVLAGVADGLRREKPTLLLAAGDMVQGHAWANLFQGKSVVEVMNRMAFDAMVVGNHEFDFGQKVLKERISEAAFPVLGANVKGFAGLKPYVVKEVGGVRVAVIGVVTPDTATATHPRNVAGLQFLPPEAVVERALQELRGKADLFVVLSHIGYQADRILAEKVKGIDIIVGGHSHTRIDSPSPVGATLIVQAWEHGKALGVVDVTVEDGKVIRSAGRLEMIRPTRPEGDADIEGIVQTYQEKMDAVLNGKVGEAEVDLDGENVRKRETNLGDLVTDIMRRTAKADVALINGGGIRTSIAKGEIRVRDIYSVLPFDNYIVAIRLTGSQIREALEHGVSSVGEDSGRFPQVSGLRFRYAPSAPAGSRVREILIGGKPVDPRKEYTVATIDYLAAGGDGYKAFGEAVRSSKDFSLIGGVLTGEKLVYNDPGKWLREVVIGAVRAAKKISPKLEGRIKEVD